MDGTLGRDLGGVVLQGHIVGIGMQRKLRVGGSVFVRTIEQRLGRQCLDAAEARPELAGFTFEHPPAAECEHRIADEGDAR